METGGVLHAGRIVGLFGVGGDVKIMKQVADGSHFDPGRRIMLLEDSGWYTPYTIRSSNHHKRTVRVRFEEIEDRKAAEKLVGADLFIPREQLPETEAGAYYWCDLIGLSVYDVKEGHIGRVRAMIETGSNDVFVVGSDDEGGERLIPHIEHVVLDIDLETGRMRVDLPEGL